MSKIEKVTPLFDVCCIVIFLLVLAQCEIAKLESKKMNEIEEMRQRMVKITNEAALTVLGLKNDLARVERTYLDSITKCHKWEKILAKTKDALAAHTLEKERNLDVVQYLYLMLCKRRGRSLWRLSFSLSSSSLISIPILLYRSLTQTEASQYRGPLGLH